MRRAVVSYRLYPRWRDGPGLLGSLRECFAYGPGEDRATGCLYAAADRIDWPSPLAGCGPALLADLAALLDVTFTIAAFQAYRDGAGCGWHADTPFGAQAILSLGVTRQFGVRPNGGDPQWLAVADGDLVVMPDGFQRDYEHCVAADGTPGERVALVFRVPAGG